MQLGELRINLNNLLQRKDSGWSWSLEPSNGFTVSSLRRLIDGISLPPAETKTIWVQWVPSKVNIHLWRTLRDRLATLDNLSKRGVSVPSDECNQNRNRTIWFFGFRFRFGFFGFFRFSVFSVSVFRFSVRFLLTPSKLCNAKPETLNHLFGECSTASIVSAHLSCWLEWWPIDASTGNNIHRTVRRVITAAFFWVLWTQRNSKIFKGSLKKEREMCEEIHFKAFDWIRCRSNFGKFLTWENWCCNPIKAVSLCIALAPR
ncbi:hypothetical protein OSB04_020987 [Centaurea solstitialis]|uniref:Reverse transcriptase zinc-binding domain-containing protein n=1 Tax=Centaurea solstitialis TaxID=347529 RepID=A0AA38STD4_9ASTR|nr:hypothetical protein OSB04_020987 [Centaurea solstitialis]